MRLIDAERCIELGTYAGYSALAVALALPTDGKLVACDVGAEWTASAKPSGARPAWRSHRSELRTRARDARRAARGGRSARFDFAFIDADKPDSRLYERLLKLVRRAGLMAVDDTLALAGAPIIERDSTNLAGDAGVQRARAQRRARGARDADSG